MTIRYKVRWLYDGVAETHTGTGFGDTYGDAVNNVIKYYGEDNLDLMSFYLTENNDVVEDGSLTENFNFEE